MGVINGGKYRMSMRSSPQLTPHTIQLQSYSTNHGSFPSPIVNAISSHDAFSHAVPSARNFHPYPFIWLSHIIFHSPPIHMFCPFLLCAVARMTFPY